MRVCAPRGMKTCICSYIFGGGGGARDEIEKLGYRGNLGASRLQLLSRLSQIQRHYKDTLMWQWLGKVVPDATLSMFLHARRLRTDIENDVTWR